MNVGFHACHEGSTNMLRLILRTLKNAL